MRAIEIVRPGGPEVLVLGERPRPVVGAGDVLIKVAAAGVNRPDAMQRQGKYPTPPGASDIPGLEVAGDIVEVGACRTRAGASATRVRARRRRRIRRVLRGAGAAVPARFRAGWIWCRGGAFLKPRSPSGRTCSSAGGSPVANRFSCTADRAVSGRRRFNWRRAFGARVFATAGSAEKCAACERLGAERAFNYREVDFVAAVRESTGGRGVDVVLDMVGGDYVQRNIESLAVDGRLVQIAPAERHQAQINTDAGAPAAADDHRAPRCGLEAVEQKGAIARAVHGPRVAAV